MDRFVWLSGYEIGEEKIYTTKGIRLYDGDNKTSYENGDVILTSYRIIWQDPNNIGVRIYLGLNLITSTERQAGGLGKSAKICFTLSDVPVNKDPGPYARSRYNQVKLSFRNGGDNEFFTKCNQQLQEKKWISGRMKTNQAVTAHGGTSRAAERSRAPELKISASGIGGIRRDIEEANRKNEASISNAFQDMTKLMNKAREMVDLSNMIATKIKEKKGDITDDETIKFKAHLLSLGIPNPVTKETHGNGTHYHMQLAHEICKVLRSEIDDSGGIMLLADAYCRINRARGMELLSPDDLLNACKVLGNLKLPLKLREFDSGVLVIQSSIHSDELVIKQTKQLVEESNSLSAQEIANIFDISVLLAKERLLLAEKAGQVCRDDSSEGLRFYPNLFLTKTNKPAVRRSGGGRLNANHGSVPISSLS